MAQQFGFGDIAEMAGLLHDIGKYQDSFQRKIRGEKCEIEHSICGAKEALDLLIADKNNPINLYNKEVLAYIIAAHHSGLPDCGTDADNESMTTLKARLKRSTEDFSAYKRELTLKLKYKQWARDFSYNDTTEKAFAFSILTRLLFSALVDSDSLETEKFYSIKERENDYSSFSQLKDRLDAKLATFSVSESLNRKRNQIRQSCLEKAKLCKGLYTLTVPTGGGKTLSSMTFAINHLLANGHRRIIYVVPYTSIIEQIAKEFKSIFGENNVLEHHSNFTFEDNTSENSVPYSATENWDAPIVITTNVQFFESLFSNKRGSCRKLHNIANSVIVFDEAQMLPIPLLKPCLKAIDILTRNFSVTALLMSATCPNYLSYLCKDAKITELNENFTQHYIDFKRVNAEFIGTLTDGQLLDLIDKKAQTLMIVNTRKHAYSLYNALPQEYNKYHLSTLMCPIHRRSTFDKIKKDLSSGTPCVVVSTQLIECGVDLDFTFVYRSLAGIDSLVQAGGRCNREGKRQNSKVFIFESDLDPKRGDIPIFKSITKSILKTFEEDDLFSLKNIKRYFEELLLFKDSQTDSQKIMEMFSLQKSQFYLAFNFAKCANVFKYIDTANRHDIVIPVNKHANQLIRMLKEGGDARRTFRELSQYTISVYEHEFKSLYKAGKIDCIDNCLKILNDLNVYDGFVGLKLSEVCGQYDDILVI